MFVRQLNQHCSCFLLAKRNVIFFKDFFEAKYFDPIIIDLFTDLFAVESL